MSLYRDRADAGRRLAAELTEYARGREPIVLALPRGGVPVGYEVAKSLGVPLDVYIVRKLGVPGREELAMGAVASDGSYVVDEATVAASGVTPRTVPNDACPRTRRGTPARSGLPRQTARADA